MDAAGKELAPLTAEQRLIGRVMSADWSAGAVRIWPRAWFQAIDWNAISRLAWQYKLRPMTAEALREAGWPCVPAAVRASLEKAERECVTKSLRQISLLREIVAAAHARKLRVIVMKGVALSAHLYGDPFIREAYDLDLLVHPDEVCRLDDILFAAGCKPCLQVAPLTPRQEAILERFHYDRKFVHAGSGVIVERHRALDGNPYLIATDFDELWKNRTGVQISDYSVAIMGNADLTLYLGVHAARHAWERWKWIADLAVLFRRARAEELLRLREAARRAGILPLFDSWIVLVGATTGRALPPEIARAAALDRKARRFTLRALQAASIAHTPQTITNRRYKARTLLSRFFLKRGFRYLAFEFVARYHREKDWYDWRLPDRLIPLYYLFRPMLYVYRRLTSFVHP